MYGEHGSRVDQGLVDETAIANMIKVLTTPGICQHLSKEEQTAIITAVKLHVLDNAHRVSKVLTKNHGR